METPIIHSYAEYTLKIREDPATPPKDAFSPIGTIPRDVLLMILKLLSPFDVTNGVLVSRSWLANLKYLNMYRRDKKEYCEAQFIARRNVLECFLKILKENVKEVKDSENAEVMQIDIKKGNELLEETKRFLKNTLPLDFTQFMIPSRSSFQTTDQTGTNKLLIAIQTWIESLTTVRRVRLSHFSPKNFFIHANNAYEQRAYRDCLMPRLISSLCPSHPAEMEAVLCTLTLFEILVQAYYIGGGFEFTQQQLVFYIDGLNSPDQLRFFNPIFEKCSKLNTLNFKTVKSRYLKERVERATFDWISRYQQTFNPMNFHFNWNAGSGLLALKQGLVGAPNLAHLHFSDLQDPIDCNNAIYLADIIIERQKRKPDCPITKITFSEDTLAWDPFMHLMNALKNYPVPILVIVKYMPKEYYEFYQQLWGINKMLNLRFETNYSKDANKCFYVYIPETNELKSLTTAEAENIEKKRNGLFG